MEENVGRTERWVRVGVGGALAYAAIRRLGKDRLAPAALLAAGAVLVETAITRVCPINGLLGIGTRSRERSESEIDESLPNPFPHAVPFQTNAASGPPSSTAGTTAPGPGTSPMGSMRTRGDSPSVVTGQPTGGATAPPSAR